METVLNLTLQELRIYAHVAAQKVQSFRSRKVYGRDAALVGLAVVVLGLYFKETQLAVHIGAHPHLLPPGMSVMVGVVENVVTGVVVDGGVVHVALAVNLLHPILVAGHLEQSCQFVETGDKLGVGAVHQSYAVHLFKGDWVEL